MFTTQVDIGNALYHDYKLWVPVIVCRMLTYMIYMYMYIGEWLIKDRLVNNI